MDNQKTIIVEDGNLVVELKSLIENIANSSLKNNEIFTVGLSGGSLVNLLEKVLPTVKTSWDKWRFIFCDERIVSFDSPDSTFGVYKSSLIGNIPFKESQFIKVNPQLSAVEAAIDYTSQIKSHFGNSMPQFDLLLLGLGPDGHTCSLFPQHPLLFEKNLWVAPITDSPKPPPSRITLTFPVINNAKNCLFVVTGKSKADIVKRILVDGEDLPARRVKPTSGNLYWMIDKAAAAYIPSDN